MKRGVAVAVTAFLVVSAVAPAVAAAVGAPSGGSATVSTSPIVAQQSANNSTTPTEPTWEPPGPFSYRELTTGGTHDADAPPAARSLGMGGIILRYVPVSPLQTSAQPLKSGQRLETDYIQAYTATYGDAVGEYQFVVVFWEKQTKRVNGTTVSYAANQSVQRISFQTSEGYATSQLKLRSHFEDSVRATAWIEHNGERVQGARWLFSHRSNPLTASPAYPINGKGDIWRWASVNLILPALAGTLVSGATARHVLDRVVVSAQKSEIFWGVSLALVIAAAVGVATWQTAVVLANAPFVVGILMGAVAFPVMLSLRDADVTQAGFFRREVHNDAVSPGGEGRPGTRRVSNTLKDVIEHDDTLYAPAKSIRSMLARYWAAPASVPVEEMRSYDSGDGDLGRLFEVDPESDKVLKHTPARLTFAPTVLREVDDDELADAPEGGIAAVPKAISVQLSNLATRINWRFVTIALGGGAVVYGVGMAVFNAPLIAGGAALLPALVGGTEARDGRLDVDWGPTHYEDVRAIVATERDEYKDRSTYDALLEAITEIEFDQHKRALQFADKLRSQAQELSDETHGGPPVADDAASEPSTGVADD
ncbi:hypothetical protein [Halobaculum gomorrense]|uniref:Uncharacterized protein n=1 Tax=Halobaculum gomorrense TaxID=43928 RepID=A0A1M5MM05_9EURY|nr:hypothetical protein [Halobaculum gomorrense]SHG78410.1 hypothetical protein SAMN05443636_1064 [Halobaculum gomorrense]